MNMEQQTGSKSGKEYVKAVYCQPCLFNVYAEYIMWNAGLDEVQAGICERPLSQHQLLGFEIAQLEFHHLH